MKAGPLNVVRRANVLAPDDRRVISRFFAVSSTRRIRAIIRRVLRLSPEQTASLLARVMVNFSARHRDLQAMLRQNYRDVAQYVSPGVNVTEDQKLLIGAYFMMEYAIESAALFNPSIVKHPDQSDVPPGSVRFLMSLRATGEGHISSIVFREGFIGPNGEIEFVPAAPFSHCPKPVPDRIIDKALFLRRLKAMGVYEGLVSYVLDRLGGQFTRTELEQTVNNIRLSPEAPPGFRAVAQDMLWLAQASYELRFPDDIRPSEAVIFPATKNEAHGMEDLRLVRFVDDDGTVHYYGTYTAFDGSRILPMLLDTCDFKTVHINVISGKQAKNKGMALFPRRFDGHYLMISRHDGESLYLLESEDLNFWNNERPLYEPTEPWEFTQIGNCGSPLETEAGWILLTHGVGPVRQYCIGALLLDRNDPANIIGRLREPLLIPNEIEREGYVPNVVYSCGAMVHNGHLIIPYAMADSQTSFAEVNVNELLELLIESGP